MFGVTDHFVNVQSPDEPTTPFDPSFLFRCYVFTISAIADFDDAARREATANANQTRVDERKYIYSQYLRVRVVVPSPSAPRRDVKVRCHYYFGPLLQRTVVFIHLKPPCLRCYLGVPDYGFNRKQEMTPKFEHRCYRPRVFDRLCEPLSLFLFFCAVFFQFEAKCYSETRTQVLQPQ